MKVNEISERLFRQTEYPDSGWRYFILLIWIGFLILNIRLLVNLSPGYPGPKYGSLLVSIMLVLHTLDSSFRWPRWMTGLIRSLKWVWGLLTFGYLAYALFIA